MFCMKCQSQIWAENGTKYCADCTPKTADPVICDVWGGTTQSIHLARYIDDIEDALTRARTEIGHGNMVNIIAAARHPSMIGAFDIRKGIKPQRQGQAIFFDRHTPEGEAA